MPNHDTSHELLQHPGSTGQRAFRSEEGLENVGTEDVGFRKEAGIAQEVGHHDMQPSKVFASVLVPYLAENASRCR